MDKQKADEQVALLETEISMETIEKMHKGIIAIIQSDEDNKLIQRQHFQGLLDRIPPKEVVKIHPFLRNVKYLPISYVEGLLDALFFSQWDTKNFKYQLIGNELSGDIELTYLDPITKRERTLSGSAAVQIQVNALKADEKKGMSKEELSRYALDLHNNKKPAALVGAIGTLKTDCLKNATKSIGSTFGRNLNRDIAATPFQILPTNYEPIKKIIDERK